MEIINGLGLETELRLGLPGCGEWGKNEKKRAFLDFFESEGEGKGKQVVGWPPVRSCRQKKMISLAKVYVKVSMDGAPFLRKIDLEKHKEYTHLVMSLEQLFGCFGIGKASNDNDDCEYTVIYEDKDGDWMLLGDVPWEMFIESCKRLRITKKPSDETSSSNGLEAKDFLKGLSENESSSQ